MLGYECFPTATVGMIGLDKNPLILCVVLLVTPKQARVHGIFEFAANLIAYTAILFAVYAM